MLAPDPACTLNAVTVQSGIAMGKAMSVDQGRSASQRTWQCVHLHVMQRTIRSLYDDKNQPRIREIRCRQAAGACGSCGACSPGGGY